MSKTRKEDIAQMSVADLQQKIRDDRETFRRLRFNHAVSPLENPMLLRTMRREIARLETEVRRRQMAEQTVNKAQ